MRHSGNALNEVILESMESSANEMSEYESEYELGNEFEQNENEFSGEAEAEWGAGAYEMPFDEDEYEFDFADDAENEFEAYEYEANSTGVYAAQGLTEAELESLASDLMALQTPQEAEEFLGKIFKGAKKLVKFARPFLKRAAPLVGAGLGSFIPGLGTAVGGIAGKALGSALGGGGGRGRRRRRRRSRGFSAGRGFRNFLGQGGNPLAAILQSKFGKGILGQLMGREMESVPYAQAQFELAKNIVRTLDQVSGEMEMVGESEGDYFEVATDALSRAVSQNIPVGVRPALLAMGPQ